MPGKVSASYKLKLNSVPKLEELLQELYDETCKNIIEIQREITKLATSVDLSTEIMDSKAKYAKAMNDYSTNKNKALATKMDVAKLMMEVLKYNGNIDKMNKESEELPNWNEFTKDLNQRSDAKEAENATPDVYKI